MHDEIDARIWVEHRHQFSEDLHRLYQALKVTFRRMAEINFAAPWRQAARDY